MMRKLRYAIAVCGLALIVFVLVDLNYNDLSWHANKGNYILLVSMMFTVAAMIFTNIAEGKHKKS